jgi:hypothetical protein
MADTRKAERYAAHAGSNDVDDNGWRLDRRGFVQTRDALRQLAIAQALHHQQHGRFAATTIELAMTTAARPFVKPHALTEAAMRTTGERWWTSRRAESGWIFAIGSHDGTPMYFDGPAHPLTGPSTSDDGWRTTDDGNWSGDCHW